MSGLLGILNRVDLRDFWKDEAREFTPWLSKEENLNILADTLGLELELVDTEVNVGNFNADIVAKDISNDRNILIENQLEKTNHDHLGKIITYASGLDAQVIVWICNKVTEEHRRAVDWLNDITNDKIAFFALEIELWKIDDSAPAPKFNIVCSPNEWAKIVKSTANQRKLTDTKLLQGEFWNSFKEYIEQSGTLLKLRRPRPQHWYSISVGRSKFNINLTVNTQKKRLGCEIYIRGENAKGAFSYLKEQSRDIESELGYELDWQELPDKQDARIIYYSDGDILDKNSWETYFDWFKEQSESFHKVFSNRIKNLDLS